MLHSNRKGWGTSPCCPFSPRLISHNPEVTVEVLAEMSQQLSVSQRNQAVRLLTSMDTEHKEK